jgi:protease-4
MSFKTASAILRGRWLIDKQWASSHMPLILSALQGKQSFSELYDDKEYRAGDDEKKPVKVLSKKYGTVYKVGYSTDLSRIPSGSIAMLTIAGPVTKYGDMCAYGMVDHAATINRLGNAPNVEGIILNLDSPGGEASGTAMLADTIKAATRNKPVVTVINDGMAASAGMWIASAANEIYTTQKTDQVGSVGVYTTIADWYGYFAEQGLNVRDIYAPQSTDKNLDYKEALKEPPNDEPVKEDLAVLANQFIDTIKQNRGSKLTGDEWTTGKMFYSKQAAKIGLTDGQKTFDQVVRRMDSLIKQRAQSNSNNMAFEKTLFAAKAQEFEVTDGGFLLQEEELNNIEIAITAGNEAIIANAQFAEDIATEKTAREKAEADLATSNATIENLNAKIIELGKKDGVLPSTVITGQETGNVKNGWNKYRTSVDDEADKMRAFAK